jgi:hypothetical protein
MVHEKLFGEGKLLRDCPEIIFIMIVLSYSLYALSDKLSISTLFNKLALYVIVEEF